MTLSESLIELFSRGGPVMFCIAGVSIVAWFLSLRTWLMAGALLKRLQKIPGLVTQDSELVGETAGDAPAVKAQTVELNSGLWLIGTFATVLPLLGLLGTVLGMLLSFEVINTYGTSQPRLLAGGIGQALITTQAGLWTAVPVLFFHHIIRRRIRLIRNETEMLIHIIQAGSADKTANSTSIPDIRKTRRTGEC